MSADVVLAGVNAFEKWIAAATSLYSCLFVCSCVVVAVLQELGNYGEYSGAPNTQETYTYAKTVGACICLLTAGRSWGGDAA